MSDIRIIGSIPLEKDASGKYRRSIGSFFLETRTLISLPKSHAMQQLEYRSFLQKEYAARGEELTEEKWETISASVVDLILRDGLVLIRPVPSQMKLAFAADELLQTLVPKHRIRYLHASDPAVRQALRERGENWRIAAPPCGVKMIIRAIRDARTAIAGLPIYYYNFSTGTRWLTYDSFLSLRNEPDEVLRAHLIEIRDYSSLRNRSFYHEISFFAVEGNFGSETFKPYAFENLSSKDLRNAYSELCEAFKKAVPESLRSDLPESAEWRRRMFLALSDDSSETTSAELPDGLPPEFFLQIHWLPGGRREKGALVFDSIFDYARKHPEEKELAELCDERVKGFICNYVREFANIRYANIGGLLPDLSHHRRVGGHRAYIAEIMCDDSDRPIIRIIRIQRWGVQEHLDQGHDLLWATTAATEYTQYTLNRKLGCWELGMPLPTWQSTNMIPAIYHNEKSPFNGTPIWTTYFERNHIHGIASDKLTDEQLKNPDFAIRFARLLGVAAAPNIVVGRAEADEESKTGCRVTFDQGDEILKLDPDGLPEKLVVADHTGTFFNTETPLIDFAQDYMRPVFSRWNRFVDPELFRDVYIGSFLVRLRELKSECPERLHVFDAILDYNQTVNGSFGDRWYKVIRRLQATDLDAFEAALYACEREEDKVSD